MVKIEKSYRNMAVEVVRDLYGDFPTLLQEVAKQELEKELRTNGVRSFTTRADGKVNKPFTAATRRVDFRFLAELSKELLRELQRVTGKQSYHALTKRSGALGTEWRWMLDGRWISSPENVDDFSADNYLWLVAMVPYAVKAQKKTRQLAGHSIIAFVSREMRKKRQFKDFVFTAIYPKIDGVRRPTISVRLRAASEKQVGGFF